MKKPKVFAAVYFVYLPCRGRGYVQAVLPICMFITAMVPVVNCSAQTHASHRDSSEVLELPPPEGALGLSQLSPAVHLSKAFLVEGSTSLHYEQASA